MKLLLILALWLLVDIALVAPFALANLCRARARERTCCAACGRAICDHSDAEYQGVIPAPNSVSAAPCRTSGAISRGRARIVRKGS